MVVYVLRINFRNQLIVIFDIQFAVFVFCGKVERRGDTFVFGICNRLEGYFVFFGVAKQSFRVAGQFYNDNGAVFAIDMIETVRFVINGRIFMLQTNESAVFS